MSATIPKTQKVILIKEHGGPEVLQYADHPVPEIGESQLLVKNAYAGINFIESYFRTGIYPIQLPAVLGREATGVVVAKGSKVSGYEVGDKVAYLSGNTFAQYTAINPAANLILKLPPATSDEELKKYAGSLVNAFTVLTFIEDAYNVQKGDYILVHAIAGGCGLLFAQLLKAKGAIVIGTASTPEKMELGKEYGADYVINSKTDDIVAKVKEITNGAGVAAVYDGVGKDTFKISLQAVARKGTLVSFGNASGLVPPLTLTDLSPKNVKVLRPQVFAYVATPEEVEYYSKKLFAAFADGLKINITETFPLSEYKIATEKLEARKTTGKLVLAIP